MPGSHPMCSGLVGPSGVVIHKRCMINLLNHTTGVVKNSPIFAPGQHAYDAPRVARDPHRGRTVQAALGHEL